MSAASNRTTMRPVPLEQFTRNLAVTTGAVPSDEQLLRLPRTDWFPGSDKPVRSGVYERKYGMGMSHVAKYCFWDAEQQLWGCGEDTAWAAQRIWLLRVHARDRLNDTLPGATSAWVAPRQSLPWRGLTREWGVQ